MRFFPIDSIVLLIAVVLKFGSSLAYIVFSQNYYSGANTFNPYQPELGWTFLTSPDGEYEASNVLQIQGTEVRTGNFATWGPKPGPYGYYGIFQLYVKLTDGPFYVPKGSRMTLKTVFYGSIESSLKDAYGYLSNPDLSPTFGNCGIWLVDVENQVTTRLVNTNAPLLYLVHERLGYPGMGGPDSGAPPSFQGYSSWVPIDFSGDYRIEYDRVGEGHFRIYSGDALVAEFSRPGAYPSPLSTMPGAKTVLEFASSPTATHEPVDSAWFQVYMGCGHDMDKLDPSSLGITREEGAEQLTTSNIYSIPSEFMHRYNGELGSSTFAKLYLAYIDIEIDKIFCINQQFSPQL